MLSNQMWTMVYGTRWPANIEAIDLIEPATFNRTTHAAGAAGPDLAAAAFASSAAATTGLTFFPSL